MDEYLTVWQFFVGMIGLSISVLLYMLGGRSDKIIRRLGAALALALTVNGLALWRDVWDIRMLLVLLCLFGGFSMGYGAETTWSKLARRMVYALGVLSAGALMAYLTNGWAVFVPHAGVGLWSIYLGVKNPVEATAEEGWICGLLNMGLLSYVFIL